MAMTTNAASPTTSSGMLRHLFGQNETPDQGDYARLVLADHRKRLDRQVHDIQDDIKGHMDWIRDALDHQRVLIEQAAAIDVALAAL